MRRGGGAGGACGGEKRETAVPSCAEQTESRLQRHPKMRATDDGRGRGLAEPGTGRSQSVSPQDSSFFLCKNKYDPELKFQMFHCCIKLRGKDMQSSSCDRSFTSLLDSGLDSS